ncbi:MAG: cytochrome c biogenesis protein ResB [bacterium]
MKFNLKNFGRRLFGFLSSLKLAVIVLASLGVVLAVGTVYESLYDTDTAQHYVYGTYWFAALLGLLWINVLFAALSRWPWKRHHIGFLVTHLGILVLLIGSLLTLIGGYEGQMILAEGETGKKMTIKEPQLFFYDVDLGKLEQVPAEFRFNPPSAAKPWSALVLGDLQARVDDFLLNAAEDIRVEGDNPLENPALLIKISGSRASMQEWVFARELERQSLNLGPAAITFVDVPELSFVTEMLRDPKTFSGPVLWLEGKALPVQPNLQKTLTVGGLQVKPLEYLPNAAVDQNGLKNLSADRINPALTLEIQGPQGLERHTVFSRFPMLPTVNGERGSRLKPRLLDFPPNWDAMNNALLIARTQDGALYYALKAGGAWNKPEKLVLESPVATGWMDFQFSALKAQENARIEKVYRKVSVPNGQEGPPSALHLSLAGQAGPRDFWIGRGESRDVDLGGRRLKVAYGLKSKPIGFELRLDDFRMGTYEGTKDPSAYESQVTLIDTGAEVKKDFLIAMNQPLKYGKYKFFQASYQLNPGGPDYSVLAVAYDPGIFLKYLGSLVMVSGIVLMFFFKPLFVQKRIAARKAQAASAPLGSELPLEKVP